jgi:hypothetical protein
MLRKVVLTVCLALFLVALGCGPSSKDRDPNPSLEYSKEGPPKRGTPGTPSEQPPKP